MGKIKGFFDKDKKSAPYKSSKGTHSCASCGLYKDVLSPRIKPWGEFAERIMVIGEAPGGDEDRRGKPWQGKAGRALERKYRELGIDLFQDCVSLNAINCRPTDENGANRAPSGYEIACCRRKVLNAISRYNPRMIILHGGSALESVIGYRWSKSLGGITKWSGWTIPDRDFNAWLCPTFHPSYVERQKEQTGEVTTLWEKDLRNAFARMGDSLPDYDHEEECVIIPELDEVEEVLKWMNDPSLYTDPPLLAFDIEATGLKPYNQDVHEIVTIAFCNRPDRAYAMPMPTDDRNLRLLKELLENPEIGKVAANMKYEDNWLTVLHGIRPRPWAFDTMQAAHVLDNRPGITSLKFQAYVRFGLLGYDEEVKPYLKSPSSNEVNRIHELTQSGSTFRELLVYNGIDALAEYRLARQQMEELDYG